MDPETEAIEDLSRVVLEEDADAPPETIFVKMRGRPAGSKSKPKAESIHVREAPQPDPMYTALMKRLDAMDGMLAKRATDIKKKDMASRNVVVEPIREIAPAPAKTSI